MNKRNPFVPDMRVLPRSCFASKPSATGRTIAYSGMRLFRATVIMIGVCIMADAMASNAGLVGAVDKARLAAVCGLECVEATPHKTGRIEQDILPPPVVCRDLETGEELSIALAILPTTAEAEMLFTCLTAVALRPGLPNVGDSCLPVPGGIMIRQGNVLMHLRPGSNAEGNEDGFWGAELEFGRRWGERITNALAEAVVDTIAPVGPDSIEVERVYRMGTSWEDAGHPEIIRFPDGVEFAFRVRDATQTFIGAYGQREEGAVQGQDRYLAHGLYIVSQPCPPTLVAHWSTGHVVLKTVDDVLAQGLTLEPPPCASPTPRYSPIPVDERTAMIEAIRNAPDEIKGIIAGGPIWEDEALVALAMRESDMLKKLAQQATPDLAPLFREILDSPRNDLRQQNAMWGLVAALEREGLDDYRRYAAIEALHEAARRDAIMALGRWSMDAGDAQLIDSLDLYDNDGIGEEVRRAARNIRSRTDAP